ncbi:MAG TPA: TorF family putative porin [Sphingobium sp.]|uniref:TorF family putative porin n=1 Tax=Sphingobium sp. TaxID=1912891 RepID=UPI002ED383A8
MSGSAIAQSGDYMHLSAQVVSDYRLRGLGWSEGKATVVTSAVVPVIAGSVVHATAFGARGAERAGGAELGLRIGARQSVFIGPVRADVGGSCRIFVPAGGMTFCEMETGASFDLAWASIYVDLAYAPPQSSIGGDNLYMVTGASTAIPGSPVTLSAHVGRSSGTVDDIRKSMRLRPQGQYWDYGFGVAATKGRLTLGGRYFGTSASSSGSDPGVRDGLVAEVRMDF